MQGELDLKDVTVRYRFIIIVDKIVKNKKAVEKLITNILDSLEKTVQESCNIAIGKQPERKALLRVIVFCNLVHHLYL